MKIADAIALYCGGPGSGCNPKAGVCGRHPGHGGEKLHNYKYGSVITQVFDVLKDGKTHEIADLADKFGYTAVKDRLKTLEKHGDQHGKWTIVNDGYEVRMHIKGQKGIGKSSEKSKSEEDKLKKAGKEFIVKGPLPKVVTAPKGKIVIDRNKRLGHIDRNDMYSSNDAIEIDVTDDKNANWLHKKDNPKRMNKKKA